MKNIIISMVAKISKMDAEAKLLTAQVEAQSLMLSDRRQKWRSRKNG